MLEKLKNLEAQCLAAEEEAIRLAGKECYLDFYFNNLNRPHMFQLKIITFKRNLKAKLRI